MTYRITGLSPEPFGALFALDDAAIRTLFTDDAIAYIHAHNAAHGCFAAKVDRT